MVRLTAIALLSASLLGAMPLVAHAAPKTVCTITVNSDDEREVLRRNLPPGEYDFVELVDQLPRTSVGKIRKHVLRTGKDEP